MKNLLSKKWFIASLFVFTFIAGMGSGVLVESIFLINKVEGILGNGPQFVGDFLQSHLTYQLSLSDDQQKQLKVILDNSVVKLDTIRTQVTPEIQGIILDAQHQIEQMLTPDQQKKFNERLHVAKEHFSKSPFFPPQDNTDSK